MKIKRYFAPNMRQAMMLVKEAHGDDAVILSSRTTEDGVELVAASDPEAQDFQQKASMQKPSSSYVSPESSFNLSSEKQETVASPELSSMAQELKAVRAMLENQLSGLAWGQNEQLNPEKVGLIKRLMQMGIGWSLSQNLVEKVGLQSEQAWSEILREIEQSIPVEERDVLERGGIVALVGPTGVGKTTTIAKMASRFVMRNSPNQLALITTDCYKIGAQAQLKTFADLIGVPVHVVNAQGELYALLASLSNKKLILIDTAGMSQRDLQLSQQLTSEQDGVSSVRNYLVMSAATQLNVMKDIVKSFGQVGLQGCILTKVDEAVQLGNILTVLVEEQLSVAYMSDGQRVPEDLTPVKARDLIDQAIVLGQQSSNRQNENDESALRMGMGKEISDAQ